MTGLRFLSLLASVALAATLTAQSPARVEFFLDSDPGHGRGTEVTGIHVGGNTLTFDLSEATEGAHVLYVRTQDDEGRWSPTVARPLLIDRFQDIVYVEYFFDADPGMGRATPVPLPEQDYKAHLELPLLLDVGHLALGEHTITVRARDRFDQWTDMLSRHFTIVEGTVPVDPDPPVAGDLARIEYFFDTDPGYGMGRPLQHPSTGTNTYVMSFDGLESGAHVLYLRAAADGHWSPTVARPIYVVQPSGRRITALEYYFDDTAPAPGQATRADISAQTGEPFAFDVDIDALSIGDHQLHIRVCDDSGTWSVESSRPFTITTATGIRFTMPIAISVRGGSLILADPSAVRSGDCQVELLDAQGLCLHSATWAQGQSQLAIPLARRHAVILVRVTDAATGRYVLQKLAY